MNMDIFQIIVMTVTAIILFAIACYMWKKRNSLMKKQQYIPKLEYVKCRIQVLRSLKTYGNEIKYIVTKNWAAGTSQENVEQIEDITHDIKKQELMAVPRAMKVNNTKHLRLKESLIRLYDDSAEEKYDTDMIFHAIRFELKKMFMCHPYDLQGSIYYKLLEEILQEILAEKLAQTTKNRENCLTPIIQTWKDSIFRIFNKLKSRITSF